MELEYVIFERPIMSIQNSPEMWMNMQDMIYELYTSSLRINLKHSI